MNIKVKNKLIHINFGFIIIFMIFTHLILMVTAQDNITNVSLGNVTIQNMDSNINMIMLNIMFIFLFILIIMCIVFVKIPLINIMVGAVIIIITFVSDEIIFYPYINLLLALMCLILILKSISDIK